MFRTHTTGIHYSDKSVEWAILRKNRKGTEKIREETHPNPPDFEPQKDGLSFPAEVLKDHRKDFKGIVTVSLPTAHLLMRVMERPSVDPEELHGMVELQIDQLSPYPLDQLAISYETLSQTGDQTRVLAVAAQRKIIDRLGDLFKEQGIYIRSLDIEVLAWWSLLVAHARLPREGRVILILEDHTEFCMMIVDNGVPISFRSLNIFQDFTDETVQQEILDEIRYSMLSLETEYGYDGHCQTEIWSESSMPQALIDELKTLSPRGVNSHDLSELPNLSEGLAIRSAERGAHHIELIPKEWLDLQRRRQAMKIMTISSIVMLALWMLTASVTGAIFAFRKSSHEKLQVEAATYEAPAQEAKEARKEKDSLEGYADRSHSALECLRGSIVALPDSLEITSFDYTKRKAVRIRGTCPTDLPIYDYFSSLAKCGLFLKIKDDKVNSSYRQGERFESFSVTAILPGTEEEEQE